MFFTISLKKLFDSFNTNTQKHLHFRLIIFKLFKLTTHEIQTQRPFTLHDFLVFSYKTTCTYKTFLQHFPKNNFLYS